MVHNITWRALPAEFGNWNSVWKRFWRLSKAGVSAAFFEALTAMSDTAHLVQMFDSTWCAPTSRPPATNEKWRAPLPPIRLVGRIFA